MCTQHPIEEHCKLDPPWDGPQVIPAQLRRVDNLIFRRLNQFSRANGILTINIYDFLLNPECLQG